MEDSGFRSRTSLSAPFTPACAIPPHPCGAHVWQGLRLGDSNRIAAFRILHALPLIVDFPVIKKGGTVLPIPPTMGSGGFEPSKAEPTDLQSAPFDRSGNSPDKESAASGATFWFFKQPPFEPPPGIGPETS